eukprot:4855952-Pyramimonas_sp.AAC.1
MYSKYEGVEAFFKSAAWAEIQKNIRVVGHTDGTGVAAAAGDSGGAADAHPHDSEMPAAPTGDSAADKRTYSELDDNSLQELWGADTFEDFQAKITELQVKRQKCSS